MMCHECRFCCTLPMCTYFPGNKDDTNFDMNYNIELKNQDKKITASDIFYSNDFIPSLITSVGLRVTISIPHWSRVWNWE